MSKIDMQDLGLSQRFITEAKEPSCAVQEAVRDGVLSEERLLSYIKLKKEGNLTY